MIIELHILQNFAPSNLNRDDTGAPKSCTFGGEMRSRISSQAAKRAARCFVSDPKFIGADKMLSEEELGKRSKYFKEKLTGRLVKEAQMSEGLAAVTAEAALKSLKVKVKSDGLTEYLLFIGKGEIDKIIEVCSQHRSTFEAYARHLEAQSAKSKRKKATDDEVADAADKKESLPSELKKPFEEAQKEIQNALDVKSAADIAMFGRMIADLQVKNVDAACQVAQAFSTHAVNESEFDFYAAVDELKPREKGGAGQLGTLEFNSALYYRYANIHVEQLRDKNLDKNEKLARRASEAFLQAFAMSVPTGKQNSFASPTLPAMILIIVRPYGLCSLANAFATPVRVTQDDLERGDGLIEKSIKRLGEHFNKMQRMYGSYAPLEVAAYCTEYDGEFIDFTRKQKDADRQSSETKAAKDEKKSKLETVLQRKDELKEVINEAINKAFPSAPDEGANER